MGAYCPLKCKEPIQDDQKVFENDEGIYKDNPETKEEAVDIFRGRRGRTTSD